MMRFQRRDLLKGACGSAALAMVGDRARAESRPSAADLDQAVNEPILDLSGLADPIEIESIDLLKKGDEYFVRVRSTDGPEGVSVSNGRADVFHPILNELVIPFFIGKDARQIEPLLFDLYRYRSNYKLQGLAFWCAQAWVEFAILDLLGRIAGKSIGELFGPIVRREVPFYVASGRRDSTPQEEVEYLKGLVEESGAKAVKFRVGGRMSRNQDALPNRTKTLIPLSREELGEEIAIHADSNSSYDPPHAIEIGRMLEEIDAVYFEEPCPFDHLEETKEVTDTLTIPVAGGEQEFSEWRFRWMIQNRGVDIVQPDLHYYGGLIRSTRVARMADLAGMPTTVHISGGFGFVYMLHFASFTPDIGRFQEYKREIEDYRDWFDPPLSIKDGSLIVPEGPGVGIRDIEGLLKDAKKVG
ncbi:MAG: mandelate racemase/muconate lactonizing enzyme family protein [Candidatus Omnitrophica bacterium]|nr:mandelate racemase/muconate lactonizing enzyme family protein [Candidatus Omnitrophota bacterium]